jgi:hypothetical protein
MLDLGNHAKLHPDVVYVDEQEMTTITLDELVFKQFPEAQFNLLVLDVQGAELLVLKGAIEMLKSIHAIYTEVSEEPLYEHGCTWHEIDSFLRPFGFWMKNMSLSKNGWGDALYVKNSSFFSPLRIKHIERPGINVALHKAAIQSSVCAFSRPNDAEGAVSGVITGSYAFHTDYETRPWWQVDLGANLPIDEILVFNRIDVAASRAHSFVLKIGLDTEHFHKVYAQNGAPFGGADGEPARIKLNGAVARYVRIELHEGGYLHLDQVEVYAKR